MSDVVPEFPLHGPYSVEQLTAVSAALGSALDASPKLVWHPEAAEVLATGRTASVLSLECTLGGVPVVVVFHQRDVQETGLWHETRVGARMETTPVRVEMLRGLASGPKLSTGVPRFDAEYSLQGHPRELILRLLDAPRLEWIRSHHLAGFDITAREVGLRVDGWVVDPRACADLVRFVVEVGQRIASSVQAAAAQRASAAGHADLARAVSELALVWQREAAAYDAAQRRAGIWVALVVIAILVLLAAGVVATLYFASR